MLDKRYNLKTEEQRAREIEFAHNMKESQQKLEIEMKKAKDTEIKVIKKKIKKKASKKADEAAMVKYKDTIDKLNKEIEEKQGELDKKDEESKLMNIKIEELRWYKSDYLRGPVEQVYNSINKCEVKFDKDFTLDLDNIRDKKQQEDTIVKLSEFKLPDIRRINLGGLKDEEDEQVYKFLKHSFPDSLNIFTFNYNR